VEPARKTHFTEDEYLAVERASEAKHELVAGEIYAIAGGTPRHAAISANVARALGNALRDRPCVVLSSDQRVGVEATAMHTYPDVTVVCGPARFHPKDRNTLVKPTLVVEVLSASTESHDRGTKLAHYRRLPSLGEIVFVFPDDRRIEIHRRDGEDRWVSSAVTDASASSVELTSVGVSIAWTEIYAKLELLEP
jgi:Uma2 family endonuclease